jgi:hypothetical protein
VPRLTPLQANFSGGEWSPRLRAEQRLAKYALACGRLENLLITDQGSLTRRPGTRHITMAPTGATAVRLLTFERSRSLGYLVELTPGKARLFDNDGSGPLFETTTPWTDPTVLREIKTAQLADYMLFVHRTTAPWNLIHRAETLWTFRPVAFEVAPTQEYGTFPNQALSWTGNNTVNGVITATVPVAAFVTADVGRQLRGAGGQGTITAVPVGGTSLTVTMIAPFLGTSPIAAGDWFLMTSPQTTLAPDATAFEAPIGKSIALDAGVGAFQAQDVGRYLSIWGGLVRIHTVESITRVGATIVAPLVTMPKKGDQETDPDYAERRKAPAGAWSMEDPAWSDAKGWPVTATWFQDRLYFARDQWIWGSVSGDYFQFGGGTEDDAAVQFELADAQVNNIQWLVASRALLAGTIGNEYVIHGGAAEEPITPTAISAHPQTSWGSALVGPLRVSNAVLFVSRGGRSLRELAFVFEIDGYRAPDLLFLSEHLVLDGTELIEIAHQREPDSTIWAVTSDGRLLACTYVREQEVIGWHRHPTLGTVGSVAIIPHPSGTRDRVFLAVKRAGTWRLEYLDDAGGTYGPLNTDATKLQTISSAGSVILSGLEHLEGQTVAVVGAGAVYPNQVVANGVIGVTGVPTPAAQRLWEVGLPYASVLETLTPPLTAGSGPLRVARQRWVQVWLEVLDTLGVSVNGDRLPFRVAHDPMDVAPPKLVSGRLAFSVRSTWADQGRLLIEQQQPLPFSLIAVGGVLDVGGTGERREGTFAGTVAAHR